MHSGIRRGTLLAATTGAVVLGLASTAFACVTFMGKVEVQGARGSTAVVGTGNSHAYCSDGRPKTAAAGGLDDQIIIKVQPGLCADAGAAGAHQLPEGTYEVRYNNAQVYTYGVNPNTATVDGTYWNMTAGAGCFRAANAATTTFIGSFNVDAAGVGAWTGTLGALKQDPSFATPLTASNLCIGAPQLPKVNGIAPGNLMPYQLLAL